MQLTNIILGAWVLPTTLDYLDNDLFARSDDYFDDDLMEIFAREPFDEYIDYWYQGSPYGQGQGAEADPGATAMMDRFSNEKRDVLFRRMDPPAASAGEPVFTMRYGFNDIPIRSYKEKEKGERETFY